MVLAFALLAAIGAPVAALLFPALPRRGAAVALPAALVPFALVVFWVGQVTFGPHAVAIGLAAVLVVAVAAARGWADPDWRSVAVAYGVFAVGFLVLVSYRSFHAGITPAGASSSSAST